MNDVLAGLMERAVAVPLRFGALCEQGSRSLVHVEDLQGRGQYDDARAGCLLFLIYQSGSLSSRMKGDTGYVPI